VDNICLILSRTTKDVCQMMAFTADDIFYENQNQQLHYSHYMLSTLHDA